MYAPQWSASVGGLDVNAVVCEMQSGHHPLTFQHAVKSE